VDGVDLIGGVEHELIVSAYCDTSAQGRFHLVFTRPE
jgi:hypothetical protein